MRLLESRRTPYATHWYAADQALSGVEVADLLGIPRERVFKTLVTAGKTGQHYVFVIPVALELDLKKAARAAKEKSIEMILSRQLLPLTGYIHGGCSPIGMKKAFPTFLDASALSQSTICFSAGKIGAQIEMDPALLVEFVSAQVADLT